MPELTLEIGGRNFKVACQAGEEEQLQKAAKLLDMEAGTLVEQIGRVPENRMLLMAGLMLSDRTIGVYGELEACQAQIKALETRLQQAEARVGEMSAHAKKVADVTPAEDTALREEAQAAKAALAKATAAAEKLATSLEV